MNDNPANLLYLDMDGPVLPGRILQKVFKEHGNTYIPSEMVEMILDACNRGDAGIVISSTWRKFEHSKDAIRASRLSERIVPTMWCTPNLNCSRGIEINVHLESMRKRGWNGNYCILDDDSDMLPEQFPNFVQVKYYEGLLPGHVERIVSILNGADNGD